VITDNYRAPRDNLEWLLSRRFPGGSRAEMLSRNLRQLETSGSVLAVSIVQHWIGLMRPKIRGHPAAVRTRGAAIADLLRAGAP